MKNILLVLVVLIIGFGAFTLLGNKKMSPATPTQPSPTQSQVTTAPVVTTAQAQTTTVTLTDAGFSPKDVAIKAGTTVIWINKSGKTATVNSDYHPTHLLYPFLNLGKFENGSSIQVVVEKAGKYSYHNHFDASETGTITAQ